MDAGMRVPKAAEAFNIPTHDSELAVNCRYGSSYGWCLRCGMPWSHVKPHITKYGVDSLGEKGCFPLCENCWQLLESAEARIEYYKAIIDWWSVYEGGISAEEMRDIQRAVANGG